MKGDENQLKKPSAGPLPKIKEKEWKERERKGMQGIYVQRNFTQGKSISSSHFTKSYCNVN